MRAFNAFVLFAALIGVSPAFASGSDYAHVEDADRCFDMTLLVDVRIADCTKILEARILPKSEALQVILQLGLSYLEKHDYAHAIPAFDTVINHSTKVPWQAYAARGNAYEFTKQNDAALTDYNKAVAIAPDDPEAVRIRGVYYKNQEQYPPAIADLSRAIQLDSKNPVYFAERAEAYFGMNNKDAAVTDAKNAISLNTDNKIEPEMLEYIQNIMNQNGNASTTPPH